MAVSEELHKLLAMGRMQHIKKGEVFQSSDEPGGVNMILKGAVKRYMITNEGSLGVQIIYGANDVFPLTVVHKVLFGQSLYVGPEIYHYEAIIPTTIRTISGDELKQAAEASPMIYRDLLVEAGKHLFSSVHLLENLSLHTSYKRVAHQLVYLSRHFSEKQKEGFKIMSLTQQDIANILSLTRETVSMCINDLRKNGFLKSAKGHIIVADIEKLEKEAHS